MNRIVEITYDHKSSHLGSSLTTYPILDYIYKTKKPNDVCILSAGHGGLAQYVAIEKYCGRDASAMYDKLGVHPHRSLEDGIHVSSGSLGSAILVAVGYAVANPMRTVHVVISDGECAEGSVWEALNFSRRLKNLIIHVNINGYSAYDTVNVLSLCARIKMFNFWGTRLWFTGCPKNVKFLEDLKAHYHVMNNDDKDKLLRVLNEERVCRYSVRRYAERLKDICSYCRSWVWDSR